MHSDILYNQYSPHDHTQGLLSSHLDCHASSGVVLHPNDDCDEDHHLRINIVDRYLQRHFLSNSFIRFTAAYV